MSYLNPAAVECASAPRPAARSRERRETRPGVPNNLGDSSTWTNNRNRSGARFVALLIYRAQGACGYNTSVNDEYTHTHMHERHKYQLRFSPRWSCVAIWRARDREEYRHKHNIDDHSSYLKYLLLPGVERQTANSTIVKTRVPQTVWNFKHKLETEKPLIVNVRKQIRSSNCLEQLYSNISVHRTSNFQQCNARPNQNKKREAITWAIR